MIKTRDEIIDIKDGRILDEDYFPQKDGSIRDASGEVVREKDIDYDGGIFYIQELKFNSEDIDLDYAEEQTHYVYGGEYLGEYFSIEKAPREKPEFTWIDGDPSWTSKSLERSIYNEIKID